MSRLANVSTADLEAGRLELDNQMRALKDRKAEIAAELESRLPGEEPVVQPVGPEPEPEPVLIEADPAQSLQRRRWWQGGSY